MTTSFQVPVVGTICDNPIPGALADCCVEWSVAGATALALDSYRRRLAAKNGGQLSARDRNRLVRRCRQLGFNRVWTKFVLGVQ